MTKETFELFEAINREGLDNSQWGLCEDIEDTALYFGTEESVSLEGRHIFIYREQDTVFSFVSLCAKKPDLTIHLVWRGIGESRDTIFRESYIDLYKV